MSDGVVLQLCAACGAGFFPARWICARCGASDWREHRVCAGTVEESTVVHRSVGGAGRTALATVRLETGERLIARLDQPLPPGSLVRLHQRDGGIEARSKKPARPSKQP